MRKWLHLTLAAGLVMALARPAAAADEAQAILDKAVKASLGKSKKGKFTAYQHKTKGTLELMGKSIPFTQDVSIQFPDKFKEVMEIEINCQKYTQVTAYNGKEGWLTVNGQNIKLDDKLQAALKEAAFMLQFDKLLFAKDKRFKLSLLGEIQVDDRPAVGVQVSCKGHKDVNLYFDKKTGMVAKTEYRTYDFITNQEVTQEVIIQGYHEVDGRKMGKKFLVKRDGKKLMDVEVTEAKLVDKLDDSEFAKP
jgi:hypothetical protein